MENEEEQKLREQFQEWYRTTSDVGSKPTADWWLSKLKEAKIKQIEEIRTKAHREIWNAASQINWQHPQTAENFVSG